MSKIFLLGVCLCFMALSAFSKDDVTYERLFKQGLVLLQRGNYAEAIKTLEKLKQSGFKQPALYNNLGIAYYKIGQTGMAIFNYEQGLVLAPLDRNLLHNRDLVLKQTALSATNVQPFYKKIRFVKVTDRLILIAIIAIVLCGICYWLGILKVFIINAKLYRTMLGICVAIAVLLTGTMLLAKSGSYAIAITDHSIIRVGPSHSAFKAFELKEGEKVQLLNHYGQWSKVQNSKGQTGWVANAGLGKL